MNTEIDYESPTDGSIFSGYYDLNGIKYALYTPKEKLDSDSWKYYDEPVPGNLSEDDGMYNTRLLLDSSDAYRVILEGDRPFNAAFVCDNLDVHGHNDWYLPSFNEVVAIRKFSGVDHIAAWTSTANRTHTKVDVNVEKHKFIFVPHYLSLEILPVRRVKVA